MDKGVISAALGGGRFHVLLRCLSYAIQPVYPLNRYLCNILGRGGAAGGDPGWEIEWIDNPSDALDPEGWLDRMSKLESSEVGCFEAWLAACDDDDELCEYYSRKEVFTLIIDALRDFSSRYPGRALEADSFISDFQILISKK